MYKEFYIFRHGETDLNKKGHWQGCGTDVPLNDTGVAQACFLQKQLADKKLEAVISSPLLRARQTAQHAISGLNIPVIIEENLREGFYGEAEAKNKIELEKLYPEVFHNWYNSAPCYLDLRFPGGQSRREIQRQMIEAFRRILLLPYTRMGISTHGGAITNFLNFFEPRFGRQENGVLIPLLYRDGVWELDGCHYEPESF